MDFSQDKAVALQTAQSLGEHFLRDSADFSLQRRVTLRSIGEDLNDERGPFIGNSIQHDTRRTLGL